MLAPYWEILDKGVAGARPLDKGGSAYPVASPTNFTGKARAKIRSEATKLIERETNELFRELERQDFGGTQVLDQMYRTLALFEQSTEPFVPGDILKTIEIGERNYNLYITSTGRLGFALGR
jgi:hypothetical protein